MNPSPAFDVVLFGATGFTGRLVAEYMAEHAPARGIRWAIAGRNKAKLEAERANLAKRHPALAELPLRVADSLDADALDALAPETRVVCTTVGPYAKYGREVVRACARHGVSYCDLSGEPTFVRAAIDECHETARTNRARIVTSCGFDSIPSDLGAFMAWEFAKRVHGEDLAWAKVFVGRLRGTASGGTFASGLALLDAAKESRDVRRLLRDPHSLDPSPWRGPRDPFEDDQRTVRYDKDLERWTAPFVMATVNSRVTRRSHALFREESAGGTGYGRRFRYHEAMSFKAGARGLVQATLITASIAGLFAAAAMKPTRALIERHLLPAPGEGPSREAIDAGFFEMHVLAKTESGRRLRGKVAGTKDPGYGETAKMLSEAAFCLATDDLPPRYGALTPATAMGTKLIERLRDAGMTFEIADA